MNARPRVILASASPRRRDLLAALLDDFDVAAADVPEDVGPDARAGAERLAREKAKAVLGRHPGAIVIGADTVVFDDARSYGKPGSGVEAVEMLTALAGRTHRVATGVAVVSADGTRSACSIAAVTMSKMSEATIAAYVASGRPLDKAGAYAIQDEDVPTVSELDGCYCCVMGLPLWRVAGLLRAAGMPARDPDRAVARCASCPERPSKAQP